MFLLGIHVLSFFHKLRHDLIRELVVAFCSLILLALFYYVFNDFLNTEVKNISIPMRDYFAQTLAYILMVVSAFSAGRLIRSFFVNPQSLFQSTRFLGENPFARKCLAVFHTLLILCLVYIPIWKLIDAKLVQWSALRIAVSSCMMLLISLLAAFLRETPERNHVPETSKRKPTSSLKAMLYWRLQILLKRNKLTQFCFFLFLLCNTILGLASYLSLPFVAAFAISFWGGFLGACALSFQCAEDLDTSYLEKSSGVSHDTYLRMLFALSLILGTGLASLHALTWAVMKVFTQTLDLGVLLDSLRIFFITGIPSWIVPAVLFQIDGRRALISILASFLVGIFIATAIYASWFSLVLLALIAYYGFSSQEGRFYRA